MENQELLSAISAMLDEKLDKKLDEKLDEKLAPVMARLGTLEEGQAELRESMEEVRDSVNALLEWSEGMGEKFDFPLRSAQ